MFRQKPSETRAHRAGGKAGDINTALRRELAAGVRLAVLTRLAVLVVVALWTEARLGLETGSYYLLFIVGFALLGIAQWWICRIPGRTARLVQAALILADMLLLSFVLTQPPPTAPEAWPEAMQLRLGNHDFLYLFVALSVLTYTPGLALWTGIAAAFSWTLAVLDVLAAPPSFTIANPALFREMSTQELLNVLLDEYYVSTVLLANEVILTLAITGVLAVAVWRSRRLLQSQVRAAAESSNLARYFSPDLVPRLAQSGGMSDIVRSQPANVLFADIIGFTKFSEGQTPTQTIAMLREFHGLMAQTIFAYQGTVHKFIGDAVMATFGALQETERDAGNAIACARAMVETLEVWNLRREASGLPRIAMGIGVHYGPLVLGNIGDEQCLEFAAIGDTVNVASRLENLCRELDASLVVSAASYEHALSSGERTGLPDLLAQGKREIRGRDEPIEIFVLRRGRCQTRMSQPIIVNTRERES